MRLAIAIGLCLSLAACGADGEPVQPTRSATISLTDRGLAASGQVALHQGPVAVTLGLGF
ncbi:hypothetical protein OS190_15705 [Sulfitobacter sp. F26204]|uniref:hypothetical protein n=1 Tax=Sulfitobacter sp. F26204 TaxID=2996014 RepID=UPI00225E6B33|nr:hypothetical protein [Sulfitobacter sp. F26204]MCX7561014.1 hypothetical protein [Sulfitobacter sp. F26204]